MKSSFFLLSLLSVTAIGFAGAQQAQAEPQERGARWKFAPNVWKVEQPRIPSSMEAPAAVRQGSVPTSPGFLGLDPNMLSRPAQRPTRQVAARTVPSSQVSHKLFVPNTAYKPDFGKPVQPMQAGSPVRMATLPPGAGSPIPQMDAPAAANKAAAPVHHAISHAPHQHRAAVSGKLKTRIPHSHGASATPSVASYSTGYVPGGFLPAQSGYGMSTRTSVNGVIRTPMPRHH